jgi:hypothetical protein
MLRFTTPNPNRKEFKVRLSSSGGTVDGSIGAQRCYDRSDNHGDILISSIKTLVNSYNCCYRGLNRSSMENVVVIYDKKWNKYHVTERKKTTTLRDLQAFMATQGQ